MTLNLFIDRASWPEGRVTKVKLILCRLAKATAAPRLGPGQEHRMPGLPRPWRLEPAAERLPASREGGHAREPASLLSLPMPLQAMRWLGMGRAEGRRMRPLLRARAEFTQSVSSFFELNSQYNQYGTKRTTQKSRQTEVWKRSSVVLDSNRDSRFASGAFSEP
jgi:hypothetical protein